MALAQQAAGLELLLEAVSECLVRELFQARLCLPPQMARLRALLFEADAVRGEEHDGQGDTLLDISLPLVELHRLLSREGLEFDEFVQCFADKAD